MRILFITPYFAPTVGGNPRWATELARGLSSIGHTVRVLTRTNECYQEQTVRIDARLEVAYTGRRQIRTFPVWFPSTLASEIKHFQPDIIQTSAPSPGDFGIRRGRVPIVTLFHAPLEKRLISRIATKACIHHIATHYDAVGIQSPEWRGWLADRGVMESLIYELSVLVGRPFSDGAVPGVRRKTAQLLFVGNLSSRQPYKRIDLLFGALKKLRTECTRPWRLIVAGDGDLRQFWQAQARVLSLSNVTFEGRVSDERLHELYSESSATLLPSSDTREGFGLALAEALACGSRIILGREIGGFRTLSQSPGALTFESDNAASLSEAMRVAICSEDSGSDMERASFARRFRAEEVAQAYERMYNDVLCRRQHAPCKQAT